MSIPCMFTQWFKQSNFLDSFFLDSSFLGNGLLPCSPSGESVGIPQLVCLAVGFQSSNIVISGCEGEGEKELKKVPCPATDRAGFVNSSVCRMLSLIRENSFQPDTMGHFKLVKQCVGCPLFKLRCILTEAVIYQSVIDKQVRKQCLCYHLFTASLLCGEFRSALRSILFVLGRVCNLISTAPISGPAGPKARLVNSQLLESHSPLNPPLTYFPFQDI